MKTFIPPNSIPHLAPTPYNPLFFPHATISCVLYQGKTKVKILDRKEFDDDLYSNYNNAIIYIQSKLNTEFTIKEGPREERLELPVAALREALLNAVAHRDYFETGANILVEIYSDRLEITNPGGLAKGLKKEDLGKRSLSRNNLLFGLMQRMGLVEKVGSGIIIMKNAMKKYELDEPQFDISTDWFTVRFNRRTERWSEKWYEKWYEKGLTKREIDVLTEIERNSKTSRKNLSHILDINQSAIQKHIDKLKEKGIIERVGPAKGEYWKIIENK